MNRQEKAVIIEDLKDNFAGSKASFVINYRGLTVAQLQRLRRELRQQNSALKIAKARLVKRAVDNATGPKLLEPYLKEQIGIIFVRQEPPAVAKVLRDFSKGNESLKVIVGFMDNVVLDAQAVIRIASLPSKEVLLAQLCGTLQAPIAQCVRTLHAMVVQPLWVLKQIGEKKQQSE